MQDSATALGRRHVLVHADGAGGRADDGLDTGPSSPASSHQRSSQARTPRVTQVSRTRRANVPPRGHRPERIADHVDRAGEDGNSSRQRARSVMVTAFYPGGPGRGRARIRACCRLASSSRSSHTECHGASPRYALRRWSSPGPPPRSRSRTAWTLGGALGGPLSDSADRFATGSGSRREATWHINEQIGLTGTTSGRRSACRNDWDGLVLPGRSTSRRASSLARLTSVRGANRRRRGSTCLPRWLLSPQRRDGDHRVGRRHGVDPWWFVCTRALCRWEA